MAEGTVLAPPVVKKILKASSRKYNLSSIFILPVILKAGIKHKGFINSYLYNISQDINKDYKFYVLLKDKDIIIEKHKYFLEVNIVNKDNYLYTFDLQDFKKDIDLFIRGKYSQLSDKLKNILCNNQSVKPACTSEVYKILFRTQDKRERIEELVGEKLHPDAEVCSICNIEDEIFMEEEGNYE